MALGISVATTDGTEIGMNLTEVHGFMIFQEVEYPLKGRQAVT